MPRQGWSEKRERQHRRFKEGLEERGNSEALAEEIAGKTVNKERARAAEVKTASRASITDISSGRRGGLHSHSGPQGPTRDQLYEEGVLEECQGLIQDVQGSVAKSCWPLLHSGSFEKRYPRTSEVVQPAPSTAMFG